ncbi:hypothetical protein CBR_g29263 [Chara braunii]|uniref:Uncharacterized protein n=1 Tax=Chara braunii TaxID=69332 RepID=A0A388LAJ8_CHABU|nr:hypothetical protein CBR_g29263 [Chara braunii]|eukprot:GBG79212.1 hypothetical protein CBR_g29263 [Chara braunii]
MTVQAATQTPTSAQNSRALLSGKDTARRNKALREVLLRDLGGRRASVTRAAACPGKGGEDKLEALSHRESRVLQVVLDGIAEVEVIAMITRWRQRGTSVLHTILDWAEAAREVAALLRGTAGATAKRGTTLGSAVRGGGGVTRALRLGGGGGVKTGSHPLMVPGRLLYGVVGGSGDRSCSDTNVADPPVEESQINTDMQEDTDTSQKKEGEMNKNSQRAFSPLIVKMLEATELKSGVFWKPWRTVAEVPYSILSGLGTSAELMATTVAEIVSKGLLEGDEDLQSRAYFTDSERFYKSEESDGESWDGDDEKERPDILSDLEKIDRGKESLELLDSAGEGTPSTSKDSGLKTYLEAIGEDGSSEGSPPPH